MILFPGALLKFCNSRYQVPLTLVFPVPRSTWCTAGAVLLHIGWMDCWQREENWAGSQKTRVRGLIFAFDLLGDSWLP